MDQPPLPPNHPTFKHAELVNLPYFFPKFKTTDEVVKYLTKMPDKKVGCFLVRPSFSRPENLSISVVIPDGSIRHTSIQSETIDNTKYYYLVRDMSFPVLHGLISYYRNHSISNLEKVSNVHLLYPVSKKTNAAMLPNEVEELAILVERMQTSTATSEGDNWILKSNEKSKSLQKLQATRLRQTSKAQIDIPPELAHQYRGRTKRADSLTNRPPAPLPAEVTKQEAKYYSSTRDLTMDTSQQMRENLKASEICECGLRISDSELPNGWSVHRSRDPRTFGKMFFQSPDGDTLWDPPLDIVTLFTAEQNNFLNKISGGQWGSKLERIDCVAQL